MIVVIGEASAWTPKATSSARTTLIGQSSIAGIALKTLAFRLESDETIDAKHLTVSRGRRAAAPQVLVQRRYTPLPVHSMLVVVNLSASSSSRIPITVFHIPTPRLSL